MEGMQDDGLGVCGWTKECVLSLEIERIVCRGRVTTVSSPCCEPWDEPRVKRDATSTGKNGVKAIGCSSCVCVLLVAGYFDDVFFAR